MSNTQRELRQVAPWPPVLIEPLGSYFHDEPLSDSDADKRLAGNARTIGLQAQPRAFRKIHGNSCGRMTRTDRHRKVPGREERPSCPRQKAIQFCCCHIPRLI
jgi:hypothetical protein